MTRSSKGTKLDVSAVGSEHQKRTAPRAVGAWCRLHGFHGSPLCVKESERQGSNWGGGDNLLLPGPWEHLGQDRGASQPRPTRCLSPIGGLLSLPYSLGLLSNRDRGSVPTPVTRLARRAVSPDPAGFPPVTTW